MPDFLNDLNLLRMRKLLKYYCLITVSDVAFAKPPALETYLNMHLATVMFIGYKFGGCLIYFRTNATSANYPRFSWLDQNVAGTFAVMLPR